MNIVSRNDIVTEEFQALCAEIKALGRTWTLNREEYPEYSVDDHNEHIVDKIRVFDVLRVTGDISSSWKYCGCPLEVLAESKQLKRWADMVHVSQGDRSGELVYMLADDVYSYDRTTKTRDTHPNAWAMLKDACGLV